MEDNYEDEQRLYYVALTRAKEKLIIVCPLSSEDNNIDLLEKIVNIQLNDSSYEGNVKKYINNYKEHLQTTIDDYSIDVDLPSLKDLKKIECEKIRKYIKSNDYVISLDLTGKQLTSEELSEKIRNDSRKRGRVQVRCAQNQGRERDKRWL